jgi:3-(methylthio)propanoyl-CoA dehydrogenase
MGNYFSDNEDLRYYLDKGLDWEPIVRITEYDFKAEDAPADTEEALETYRELLELVGNFAADEIAPRADRLDREHPKVVDGSVVDSAATTEIMDLLNEIEIHRMCLPRELGGLNCPFLLFNIVNEVFARADVSITAHNGFHGGIALAMLSFSALEGSSTFASDPPRLVSTRFADYIEEIASGATWGSMDITEPGAGSDMAALRCKGELDEQGNWFVTGQKVFITSGHGRFHFVIARTEESKGEGAMDGLKGLSMFLVPAWEYDDEGNKVLTTTIDGVEEKLGHHASATVSISYERSPAHLIGKRGDGFKHMLMLMNNARVGVGFESLGVAEAAYRASVAYAAERPSMGKTIDRHEMIADYLEEMRTDIQAIRAITMEAGRDSEIAQKLRVMLAVLPPEDAEERAELERTRKRHEYRARGATPLVKYYASEKAVELAQRAIQIHGGSGYIREYGVEKLLRDAIVMPIYEGTSQIQALMAMKDTLQGVVKNPQRFLRKSAKDRWEAMRGRTENRRRVARLRVLRNSTVRFLLSRLAGAKVGELRGQPVSHWSKSFTDWDPKKDFALAMLHAERLCKILCDVLIAETLLKQSEKHAERTELLERFLERAEPRCRYWNDEITTTGLRLLSTLREADEAEALPQAAK